MFDFSSLFSNGGLLNGLSNLPAMQNANIPNYAAAIMQNQQAIPNMPITPTPPAATTTPTQSIQQPNMGGVANPLASLTDPSQLARLKAAMSVQQMMTGGQTPGQPIQPQPGSPMAPMSPMRFGGNPASIPAMNQSTMLLPTAAYLRRGFAG